MSVFKSFKVFSLYVLVLYACQSCTSIGKETTDFTEPKTIIIDKNFKSENLNKKLLICTNIKKSDLNDGNLREYLLKNSKPTNAKTGIIKVGDYHQYPDAWFYAKIINTDDSKYDLMVDEDSHLRCDGIEVITFKGDSLKNWGIVTRTMPFSERPIPFYPFAIAVSINPKDTLNLLIHTYRGYGIHDVNLNIASYHVFFDKTIKLFFTQIVVNITLVICLFSMGIVGWLFNDKVMLGFSFFLVFVFFALISVMGLTDTLVSYPNIGLHVTGLASIGPFLSNTSYHIYGMQLMKSVPKNEKWFKNISYLMMAANLLVVSCFFLPLNLFHKIDTYLALSLGVLSLATVFWKLYSSLLAYFRAKIYFFLIAVMIALLPFLYQQLINIFLDNENPLRLKISQSTFLLSVIGVSIISIYQLRVRLISRKIYEKNLTQLKETMEGIRKSEVETIGRNLHDQVGNTLASALGYLNLKTLKVDLVQKLIMDAINDIRFLSHNLVKDEEKPLTEKLEALVVRFNDFSSINFEYSDFSNAKINSLEPLSQQNIYMIIQEIMTNIIKHSKAEEAYIQIFENEKNIAINIEDDGIGMENLNENKGIGLKNIQKRVEVSNLKITTDSTPNGTSYIIEIPYGNPNSNY